MEVLFRQYLQNKCPPEAIPNVLAQLRTPAGKELMEKLLDEIDLNGVPDPASEVSERLWHRLSGSITDNTATPVTIVRMSWLRRWGWVAAASLVPFLLALSWWYVNRADKESRPTVITTAFGKTRWIVLPDSSVVKLNGNSSLTYSADWEAKEPRDVWLKGEAFFRVTHQHNHQRFRVHTQRNHVVEVLGTEFNISDRRNGTRIGLKSGKISLTIRQKNVDKKLLMRPDQLIDIDTTSQKLRLYQVKAERFTAWTDSKLVFDGTSLSDIAELLKATYNLQVVVTDTELLNEKVTGTIPSDNINDLLQALAISLHKRYSQKENQVTFY